MRSVPSSVTIVGATGDLGFGLALRLAHAGVPVVIGSRDAGRAAEAAERVRAAVPDADVQGLANPDAAAAANLVVLSVPFASQASTLRSIRDTLRPGSILLDVTVPLAAAIGGRATRTLIVPQGSAAQQAQELVPDGVTVVSGLRPIDAGRLEASRITEQLTALTIGINIRHKATAGVKLTGLPAAGSFGD